MVAPVVKIVIGVIFGCAAMGLLIFGIVFLTTSGSISNNDRCDSVSVPASLSITSYSYETTIQMSWYGFYPNAECEVIYLLQYSIDGRNPVSLNLTTNSYSMINNLEPCSVIEATLRIITKDGEISEDFVSRNYTEIPRNVQLTNITYLITDEGLYISWMKPPEMTRCTNIRYTVTFSTDLGGYVDNSDVDSIFVPRNRFCFRVTFTIATRVYDQISSYTISTFSDTNAARNVSLSILPENPNRLIVAWEKHPNAELCSVEYEVYYYIVEDDIEPEPIRTSEPEVTVNATFCVGAEILILNRGSNSITSVNATQTTPRYVQVEDVRLEQSGADAIISWTSPAYVNRCSNLLYRATATSSGNTNTCTGANRCQLRLPDYCPTTDIAIVPYSVNGNLILDAVGTSNKHACQG